MIVWQQSLSFDPAGETLRLTYQKTSGDPVQLVDELHYGNALGGADSLSARLADTLWQYAPPPALSRLSHSGAGNHFRSADFGTRGFRGGGIQIPFLPGSQPVSTQHVRGKRLYELKNHLGNVTTVVSDRKIPYFHASTGDLVYFSPEIDSLTPPTPSAPHTH